jgi:hypothetical protein
MEATEMLLNLPRSVVEPTAVVVEPTQPVVEPVGDTVLRIATPNTVSTDLIKSAAAGDIEVFGQIYARLLKANPEGPS